MAFLSILWGACEKALVDELDRDGHYCIEERAMADTLLVGEKSNICAEERDG
jgi:hypothetical protein